MTITTSNSSFNIISNNEKLDDKKKKVLDNIKGELLEALDIDERLVNRNMLAKTISNNRFNNGKENKNEGIPQGEIEIQNGTKVKIDEKRHKDILDKYRNLIINKPENYVDELSKLDTQLAEMIILDSRKGLAIEFSDTDTFENDKNANTESTIAFKELNKIPRYHNKIELIEHKNKLFIIKRTTKQYKDIREALKKIKDKKTNSSIVIDGYKIKTDDIKTDTDTVSIDEPYSDTDDAKSDTVGAKTDTVDAKTDTDDAKADTDDTKIDTVDTKTDTDDAKIDTDTVSIDEPEHNIPSIDEPEHNIPSIDDPEHNIPSIDDPEHNIPSIDDPDHNLPEQKERVATISNVTQVNRAIIQREVDEELRDRYAHVGWNIFDRANLFLRRKFIKDREVAKRLKGSRKFDWSTSGQSAADRHQIEEANNLADRMNVAISSIDADNYPETRRRLDNLLNRLTGEGSTTPPWQRQISDTNFQTEFQNILDMSGRIFDRTRPTSATATNWRPISDIIRTNNMKQLSTNILMQANKFRDHQYMVYSIVDHIALNPHESDADFNTFCQGTIQNYINTYNDIPDFMQQLGLSIDNTTDYTKEIKRLQASDRALADIAAQSFKLKIQMLDDGGEAYNVKKGTGPLVSIGRFLDDPTGGNNTKFGRRMNEHQNLKEAFGWIRGGTKIAAMAVPAMLLGPAGPLAVASVTGGSSFLMTLFKKKSHYEREHRSYQRMQATNLDTYRINRNDLANEVAGMKWYEGRFRGKKARNRRQMRDYIKTSQDQLSLSTNLIAEIERRLHNTAGLNATEQLNLAADLADGLARLDYHKKTGQNFLGSNNPNHAEEEYRALQNAVMGGITRLGISTNDLRSATPYDAYYNNTIRLIEDGTGDDYNNQGYIKARKRFKRRSNSKARHGALKAGGISFGLSYLLSNLIKKKETTTEDISESIHHGKEGGEYNPGDVQENLFVSGDINPTMRNVINDQTSEITRCDLYSSVDSLRCTYAKGHSELLLAESDLNSALSNPIISGNPDISAAFAHYKASVESGISGINGLDAGNIELIKARAYESFTEGVLDPIIHSGNATIKIDPSAINRVNGGAQSSGTGIIGQSFRNMGVVDMDIIQQGTREITKNVTRAIPIPVGLNTFGSYRSELEK